jgi:putative transposase
MNYKASAIINIFIERLWRSFIYENVYLQCYSVGNELFEVIEKYFEFYEKERFYQLLDYKTLSSVYIFDYFNSDNG